MKTITKIVAALAAGFGLASAQAQAGTLTYSVTDIGTFGGYTTAAVGQTFSGTGFVGEYSNNQFGHLFGLEGSDSLTNAQVDISALAGKMITGAVLSYDIRSDYNTSGSVTITGYNSTGHLGYMSSAPTVNLGAAHGTTNGTNTVDVTSLVSSAVSNGDGYLGLFFRDNVSSNWTYTSGYGYNADSARLRLTVNYTTPVAEPVSVALLGVGMIGTGFAARRRRRSA